MKVDIFLRAVNSLKATEQDLGFRKYRSKASLTELFTGLSQLVLKGMVTGTLLYSPRQRKSLLQELINSGLKPDDIAKAAMNEFMSVWETTSVRHYVTQTMACVIECLNAGADYEKTLRHAQRLKLSSDADLLKKAQKSGMIAAIKNWGMKHGHEKTPEVASESTPSAQRA